MLDYLVDLVGRLGHWGYLVLFLAAGLESAAFLGVFIPGESLVLVCGFLAAQGALDLDAVIVTVGLGATLGDSVGYELGRRLGRPWIERHGRRFGLSKDRLDRADAFFARHGGKSVFLGRFVGFARAVVPFLAGSSRMSYSRFLPYNALGAALWAICFVVLGYFAGASWQRAERWIGAASAILAGVVLTVLALGLALAVGGTPRIRDQTTMECVPSESPRGKRTSSFRAADRIRACASFAAGLSWFGTYRRCTGAAGCQLALRWHYRGCTKRRSVDGCRLGSREVV
jgi:membrane protein DedA with SNARE-associated domain